MDQWLAWARKVDLSVRPWRRGNGPFARFLGVCLHVNVDENGTSDDFWRNNAGQVTPNFQVYKDGSVHQILPLNWQPWCQVNGNFNYAAIETAGMPGEPMTAAQLDAIARIMVAYHRRMGAALVVTDVPGQRGFITHAAGGVNWGGHSCPGPGPRAGQRAVILKRALAIIAQPAPQPVPSPSGGDHKPVGKHLRHVWPAWMPAGHYFGLLSGPDHSHGGANPRERAAVKLIQGRLQELGYAPHGAWWADGVFEEPTRLAVAQWQHDHMPSTTFYGQVWADDWHTLFTY